MTIITILCSETKLSYVNEILNFVANLLLDDEYVSHFQLWNYYLSWNCRLTFISCIVRVYFSCALHSATLTIRKPRARSSIHWIWFVSERRQKISNTAATRLFGLMSSGSSITPRFIVQVKWLQFHRFHGHFRTERWFNHSLDEAFAVKATKWLLDFTKEEIYAIRLCHECYYNANQKRDDWFTKPCSIPHILVFAKQPE